MERSSPCSRSSRMNMPVIPIGRALIHPWNVMSTAAGSNNRAGHEASFQLTPCEFEIMEVLWQTGSGTVRQVHTALKPTRNLAYTTIMTVMDKLHRKGALAQRRQGRA